MFSKRAHPFLFSDCKALKRVTLKGARAFNIKGAKALGLFTSVFLQQTNTERCKSFWFINSLNRTLVCMKNINHKKPFGFLRLNAVCDLVGLGKTTVWNLSRNDPDFPKPVKLSARCTAWRADEVQAWIDSRSRVQFRGGRYGK